VAENESEEDRKKRYDARVKAIMAQKLKEKGIELDASGEASFDESSLAGLSPEEAKKKKRRTDSRNCSQENGS